MYSVCFPFFFQHLFPSEACNCPGVLLDDWSRAEKYAHDIIGDLNNWPEGWTDWNIVLNQEGGPNHLGNNCNAPIIASSQKRTTIEWGNYFAVKSLMSTQTQSFIFHV